MMLRSLAISMMLLPLPGHAQGVGRVQQMVTASGAPVERMLIPDIPVVDKDGQWSGIVSRFADKGPLLIAFSYTGCVTLCPITHAILADVDDRLDNPGAPPLTVLTISLDPVNDTPARLSEVADTLGTSTRWHWLAAAPTDTPALLSAMGVPSGPPEAHDPLFLLGDFADGKFRRIAGLPDPAELLSLAAAR